MDSYITKLVDGMVLSFNKRKPIILDLVLDGGAFNGSYLIGSLLMIKEMEKRNYIRIKRISACSISTICALLYYIDKLDIALEIYDRSIQHMKQQHNLDVFDEIFKIIKPHLNEDTYKKINNRMYCSYHNVKKGEKIVRHKYSNAEDLFETLRRSCHLPYMINNRALYKQKYVDGVTPHKFKDSHKTKILYIDLYGLDKMVYAVSCKKETQNYHRIMEGALDIHMFFTKDRNTSMCRFLTDWRFYDSFYIKLLLEKILVYYFVFLYILEKYICDERKRPGITQIYILIAKQINIWYFKYFCY